MQGEVVGLADDGVEIGEPGGAGVRVGVGGADQDGHAEGGAQVCGRAPAGAVADDAEGGAAQFVAGFAGPAALADCGGDLAEAPCGHDDQSDGEFGDGVVVCSGGVADPDSLCGGGLEVDGVVTDAAAGDDFQGGSAGEHVGGDRFAGEDRSGYVVEQRAAFLKGPWPTGVRVDRFKAVFAQELVNGISRVEVVGGDQDAGGHGAGRFLM